MAEWRFFTNHALVLICLAEDPDMLLREIADAVGITDDPNTVHALFLARDHGRSITGYTDNSGKIGWLDY